MTPPPRSATAASSEFVYKDSAIRYTRQGVCGRAVLFLHNGGASKEIWQRQVEELSDRFEVINVDQLGFGESDMPSTGYSLAEYVDRMSAFIDHLGYDRISVVGNCMGSAMALLLAERHPDKFEALVLINPLSEQTANQGLAGLALPLVRRLPRLSAAVARAVRVPAPLTRYVIVAQYGPLRWHRALMQPLPGETQAGSGWSTRGRLFSLVELFLDRASLEAVDNVQPGEEFPPIAVVWGASNIGLSPKAGRELNQRLRPDREIYLDRCGHLPMIEDADKVTALIADFLIDTPVRHNSYEELSG